MASHVPFLAVRPDDQFSSDIVRTRDFASSNGIPPSASALTSDDIMDAPEAPKLPRMPPASRLPAAIRFPLVCLISYSLSILFYSIIADWAGYELGAVSREPKSDYQIAGVVGWKFVELSAAWYAGYDYKDLAGLSILSNLPLYFLLSTFYAIPITSSAVALAIDVSVIAIPFMLLRPLIHAHEPGGSPNQQVAQDPYISALMALFGATIYAVVIYFSLYTWLPVYLVVNFDGVRSVQGAHDATVPNLLLYFIPMGWATAQFLFTPMIGARGNPGLTDPRIHPEKVHFDPETATLGETIAFNLGWGQDGFSKRAEVLMKRTAVLVSCSAVNTFARVLMTVEGAEAVGALGWAGVWAAAATLTSVAYSWVGNE